MLSACCGRRAIGHHLMKAADPLQFVSEASRASGVSAGPPGMPLDLEAIPAWYEQEYEARIWEPKKEAMRMGKAALNPGRTWRLGLAADVFGPSP